MEKEWSDIRELSLKQQMQAYWELLYPNRNRTRVASENEQNYRDDVALTVKSWYDKPTCIAQNLRRWRLLFS
jgi:hypothetical protein